MYIRRSVASICAGEWVQCLFYLLGFDDINFAPTDDRVCKLYGARDVLVLVPGNNGGCTKVPVDYDINDPDSVLIT